MVADGVRFEFTTMVIVLEVALVGLDDAAEVGGFLTGDAHFLGQCLGNISRAGIVAGLTAAGLVRRDDYFTACVLQKLARGKADVRPDEVYQTGNEEAHFHGAI